MFASRCSAFMKQVTVSRRPPLHFAAICAPALLGVGIAALAWPASRTAAGIVLLCLAGVALAAAGRFAGIALGGSFRGLAVRSLALGPFTIYRQPGDAPAGFAAFAAGGVRFASGGLPPEKTVDALGWSLAGGPLGIALAGVAVANLGRLVAGSGPAARWLAALGLALLVVAALDLAPLRIGRLTTDGRRIRALQRAPVYHADNAQVQQWMEVMGSAAAPGNWPEAVIDEQERVLASDAADQPHERMRAYFAGMMLYYHYADRREWPEATHVIARAVNLPRPPERRLAVTANLDSLQSLNLALRGRNPTGARFFLDRATINGAGSPVLNETALAAILLAEEDRAGAIDRAKSARRGQPADSATPVDQLVASWSDEIIELARGSAAAPARTSTATMSTVAPAPAAAEMPAAVLSMPMVVSWDPGVPSDRRALWLWRNPRTADLLT